MVSLENNQEFYVTVFSNTSVELYDNSLSKFQVKLPRPLLLNDDDKWHVAITEIVHSAIIGSGDYRDEIKIEQLLVVNSETHEVKLIKPEEEIVYVPGPNTALDAVLMIFQNAIQPMLYNRDYFKEFLSIENLKNFPTNVALKKYQTKPVLNKKAPSLMLFSPFEILETFREQEKKEDKFNDDILKTDYLVFEFNRKYTGHQVLWLILEKFYKLFTAYKKDKTFFQKYNILYEMPENKSVTEMLLFVAKQFASTFEDGYNEIKEKTITKDSNFVLVYCDFVSHRVVGDQITNVLYITSRLNNKRNTDNIVIKNHQYVPVNKTEIETMAFRFCNERGEQLYFEPG